MSALKPYWYGIMMGIGLSGFLHVIDKGNPTFFFFVIPIFIMVISIVYISQCFD